MSVERNEQGKLDMFAEHGGYEINYITEDGGILCNGCANHENGSLAYVGKSPDGIEDKQWKIVRCDIHWEGEPIQCDHCCRAIDSEYGIPD